MNTAISLGLSVLMVIALVNLLKGVGLSGKWSALAAVLIAIALNVANFYLAASGAYQAAMQGAVLGLSAAGLYDATSTPPTNVTVNNTPMVDVPKSVAEALRVSAARTK